MARLFSINDGCLFVYFHISALLQFQPIIYEVDVVWVQLGVFARLCLLKLVRLALFIEDLILFLIDLDCQLKGR